MGTPDAAILTPSQLRPWIWVRRSLLPPPHEPRWTPKLWISSLLTWISTEIRPWISSCILPCTHVRSPTSPCILPKPPRCLPKILHCLPTPPCCLPKPPCCLPKAPLSLLLPPSQLPSLPTSLIYYYYLINI